MNRILILRIAGWMAIVMGVIGVIFGSYGVYLFIVMNDLLSFMTPSYSGLAIFVSIIIASASGIFLGYKLIRVRAP